MGDRGVTADPNAAPSASDARERVAVLHVTDTLDAGGMERVAVNLVNSLPRGRWRPFLCTTRRDGPLGALVEPDVGRLDLGRRWRLDLRAIGRLRAFVRRERIRVIHAHGDSIFFATIAAGGSAGVRILWHDHFGRYATETRPAWLYRLAARRIGGVIAVNEPLAAWARSALGVRSDRGWMVPNFVARASRGAPSAPLPGVPGRRVVCLANLRPQKDHPTLLRAFAAVAADFPDAHLLLAGGGSDEPYRRRLEDLADSLGLKNAVSFLGSRDDVPALLAACDVGVLSSSSEGFPLALVEYGLAGLPAIATRTGQCAEILDEGEAGRLVACRDAGGLADAMRGLLADAPTRARLGGRLEDRVTRLYGAEKVVPMVAAIYERLLSEAGSVARGAR